MKNLKLLLTVFATVVAFSAHAQFIDKSTLPAPVAQQFTSAYPTVSTADWEKIGSKYKASFKIDSSMHKVTYDEAGAVLTNQYSVVMASVPKEVSGAIAKKFSEYAVSSADRIEEDGKIKYMITLTGGENPLQVFTSDKGLVIKTVDVTD